MTTQENNQRRDFLRMIGLAGLTAASAGCRQPGSTGGEKSGEPTKEGEEVSPAEDLMREHGVLNRVLLIYDEVLGRLRLLKDFPPEVLSGAAGIIRRFIEDYHEKLEEDFLFPRFEKAGKLVDLVGVLRQQHQAGRRLTDNIKGRASALALKHTEDGEKLAESLRLFIRMYRPHEAREDTVLFPALRSIVSPHEYDALGEDFEDKEHALFGEDGFEKVVDEVARLENRLGTADLSQFSPKV
jgi:hemerythrin-like domain-containing protein